MPRLEERVTVEAPVRAVYDRWTQFEEFPRFMSSVEEIRQLDDTHLHWKVDVAGRKTEFDAEITEQIPDARIAWKSTSGTQHAGAVDFHRLNDRQTEIAVVIEGEPGSAGATPVTDALLRRRLRGDLERFRSLVEEQGRPAAGWRGEVRPQGSGQGMTAVDKVATGLVTVGSLNWGLVALARTDLVGTLLTGSRFGRTNAASRVVYGLVGAAAG